VAVRNPLQPLLHVAGVSAKVHDRVAAAASALGHDFAKPALLAEALTHPSLGGRGSTYERLEFLGDRVLGLAVADMLLESFPAEAEGALAKRLTALVRRETLAAVAADVGLGDYLALSRGEEGAGGRRNPSVLADALEAAIGAIYLDGGFEAAKRFVRRHWRVRMAAAAHPPEDAKTRLQEWAQGTVGVTPRYETVARAGPAHSPTFEVEVQVEGVARERGTGSSKRAAEQAAAKALLARIAATGGKGRKP